MWGPRWPFQTKISIILPENWEKKLSAIKLSVESPILFSFVNLPEICGAVA